MPAGLDLVLVEGVGAGRRELADLLDAVVWVQSDFAAAERRGIARDIASGANGDEARTVAFWHEWMTQELAFLDHQRPWERACVVVAGTPPLPHGLDDVVLAPPARSAAAHDSPVVPQSDRVVLPEGVRGDERAGHPAGGSG